MTWILGDFDPAEDLALRGFGLTVGEMQAVARRQLAGSLVVAMLMLAIAAVLALRSHSFFTPIYAAANNGVQQPVFVTPPSHAVAAIKGNIEAP